MLAGRIHQIIPGGVNCPKEGIFAVYKDEGISSHDVVNVVRKFTGENRVGHAGTLDPYAKGVLVVGVGRAATRELGELAKKDKEYLVRIKLGWRSTTDDREGRIEQASVSEIPSEDRVRRVLKDFEGTIRQRPPAFSAVKVQGEAAYKLARARRSVSLPLRYVEVKEVELVRYAWPHVDLRLVTSSGFDVRSFARDLGESLGTGGYMEELERTRVGAYTKEQAIRLLTLKHSKDGDSMPGGSDYRSRLK
jgi:tRNA pseudouridine55 synthase